MAFSAIHIYLQKSVEPGLCPFIYCGHNFGRARLQEVPQEGARQDRLEECMVAAVKREAGKREVNISLDKPIYTISVASEILETHPRTLMMYEHLGLVVPKRTSTNRRRFSQRDIMKLQTIQKLTRQHSVNLAGVRYILRLLKILH